ncbi:HAD hydrolase-like protein [Candidatus Woesearchaeota archaeon]|nr:HAD hydrolase-like protein [Candidatus Woesearchaeota archaeon]
MQSKRVLVFDVDETLLNVERVSFLRMIKPNYKALEGKSLWIDQREYYISLRPKIKEVLAELREKFILVAYSLVSKKITIEKLVCFDLDSYFFKIYGEEDLLDGKKSLSIIAKDLNISKQNIIAVDDKPELYDDATNIIKIQPWFIGDNEKDYLRTISSSLITFA